MFGFGNIGPLEVVVVLIIAVIVFGPKRLPELGGSLGRGIREFRDTVSGERREHAKALDPSSATAPPPSPSAGETARKRQG